MELPIFKNGCPFDMYILEVVEWVSLLILQTIFHSIEQSTSKTWIFLFHDKRVSIITAFQALQQFSLFCTLVVTKNIEILFQLINSSRMCNAWWISLSSMDPRGLHDPREHTNIQIFSVHPKETRFETIWILNPNTIMNKDH